LRCTNVAAAAAIPLAASAAYGQTDDDEFVTIDMDDQQQAGREAGPVGAALLA
jgi:hypothetical protein